MTAPSDPVEPVAEEEDIRYYVERTNLNIEDVGADSVTFEFGGLVFRDEDGELVIAYADGTWKTVTRG